MHFEQVDLPPTPPPPSCDAPFWARGGHRQTWLGSVYPAGGRFRAPGSGWRRVRIPLTDGGCLSGWSHLGLCKPAVLILHGLGGSSNSKVARRAAFTAAELGHAVLVLDQRGSGGKNEVTRFPYMTGHSEDAADAVRWLREQNPGAPIFGIGFSLGGNTLICLGGDGRASASGLPDWILSVCAPLELDRTSRRLQRWPARFYDLSILGRCRKWMPRFRGELQDSAQGSIGAAGRYQVSQAVPRWSSLREFDKRYIAPAWGFADLQEYYEFASGAQHLTRIQIPTVLLVAEDDPIAPGKETVALSRSPYVDLQCMRTGGHLGFFSGRGLRVQPWLNHVVTHYLAAANSGRWTGTTGPPRSPNQQKPSTEFESVPPFPPGSSGPDPYSKPCAAP